jgi:endoglucanase
MLRAVWMADRAVFDKAFRWAKDNLNSGIRQDHLWAWKWGKAPDGNWRVLDKAFASDADQDVALALILASEVWSDPAYLARAREILADLWRLGTIASGGRRYLLAGDTLCQGADCKLNPSYCAPYAYRIFSQYDKSRTWLDLVESSYHLLNTSAKLTGSRLPPDWLLLDTKSGSLRLGSAKDARFSYDAIRTHWRVAFDQRLFQDPRGELYLRQSLSWPIRQWEKTQKLPAVISAEGKPEAAYESPEMLACLLPAMALVSPEIASAIHGRLQHNFKGGIWFDPESYYIQNWVWFGIALQQNYLGPFNEFRRSR